MPPAPGPAAFFIGPGCHAIVTVTPGNRGFPRPLWRPDRHHRAKEHQPMSQEENPDPRTQASLSAKARRLLAAHDSEVRRRAA